MNVETTILEKREQTILPLLRRRRSRTQPIFSVCGRLELSLLQMLMMCMAFCQSGMISSVPLLIQVVMFWATGFPKS